MHEDHLSGNEIIKVLHVFKGFNNGGVESFVTNLYSSIGSNRVQFDFLLRSSNNDQDRINYFKKNGNHIYYTADWPSHILENRKETKSFFQKHADEYDFIHIHANSLMYILPIILSHKYMKRAKIIVHSHNTRPVKSYLLPLHYINRYRLKKYPTINLACSEMAGKWMFNQNFSVVPNSIDVDRFKSKKHTSDKAVLKLVSVGRLERQKNYSFIIPVIRKLIDDGIDVTYKIAGEGTLRTDIEKMITDYSLRNKVVLLGNCSNVESLLDESDIFLMPSLYEGLSIAHLEAQCNGLPCVLSDTIPEEGCIVKNIHRIPLDEDAWLKTIKDIYAKDGREYNVENYRLIENSDYSLGGLSEKMSLIYGVKPHDD